MVYRQPWMTHKWIKTRSFMQLIHFSNGSEPISFGSKGFRVKIVGSKWRSEFKNYQTHFKMDRFWNCENWSWSRNSKTEVSFNRNNKGTLVLLEHHLFRVWFKSKILNFLNCLVDIKINKLYGKGEIKFMQWWQGMIQSLILIGSHDHVSDFFNQNHSILNQF